MLNTATAEGFLLIALGSVSGLALTGGIQGGVRVEKGDDGVFGKKCGSLGGVAHGHVQGKEHDLQGQGGRWAAKQTCNTTMLPFKMQKPVYAACGS